MDASGFKIIKQVNSVQQDEEAEIGTQIDKRQAKKDRRRFVIINLNWMAVLNF